MTTARAGTERLTTEPAQITASYLSPRTSNGAVGFTQIGKISPPDRKLIVIPGRILTRVSPNAVTGHMRFPGTITVREETFRQTLDSAARSFRLHGFRDIVFLGDHGSTQAGERDVAARLNREWAASPARVHAVEAYYRAATAGFEALLKARGYRAEEIGQHAGLSDTSLTLALEPRLVRATPREAPASGEPSGVEGDPRRASADLGRLGVDLIVTQSVTAIRKSIESSRR